MAKVHPAEELARRPTDAEKLAGIAGLAAVLFAAGRLGLMLAASPDAPAASPAAGIGLAALLLFGRWLWPAVGLGAFLVSFTTAGGLLASVTIGIGAMVQASLAARLVARHAGGDRPFARAHDVLKFALMAGLGATALGATAGAAGLALFGPAGRAAFGSVWLARWLGDAVGVLVAAPVVMLWVTGPRASWTWRRAVEGAALLGVLVVAGAALSGGIPPPPLSDRALEILCVPILAWAASRFGPCETATASAATLALATWGTLAGRGTSEPGASSATLALLQGFIAIAGTTALVVAAALSERRQSEEDLRRTRDELERKAREPSVALSDSIVQLRKEMAERKLAERLFRAVAETANEGIVSTDARGIVLFFNAAARRIFGRATEDVLGRPVDQLMPERHRSRHGGGLDRYATAARPPVAGTIGRTVELTGLRKDGAEFPMDLSLSTWDAGGETFFTAIVRDITEAKRAEQERQAGALMRIQLDDLARHTRQITVLSDMSDMLRGALSLAEAYPVIPRFLRELFPDDSGAMYVFNDRRNLLQAVARWGNAQPGEELFQPEECWALRLGQLYWVGDSPDEVRCGHVSREAEGSCLCIPISPRGETLGVLHLRIASSSGSPSSAGANPAAEYHHRLARNAAEQIALALANVKLQETLRSQASQDPLTGLFNRRHMEESLDREFHRAFRRKTRLGIIMLDLDHFKKFNDRFGHEVGDHALREVAASLTQRSRREDIVCRYGGEEFLLVLPECSMEGLVGRAEEIREGVRHLQLEHLGRQLRSFSVSLGVALYPDHGATPEAVLRAADAALYRSKTEGRNRVSVAAP